MEKVRDRWRENEKVGKDVYILVKERKLRKTNLWILRKEDRLI